VLFAAFLLALTGSGNAATIRISGDCRGCAPETPAAPALVFSRMIQTAVVTDLPGFSGSVDVSLSTPAGTKPIASCAHPAGDQSLSLSFLPYVGNGDYAITVKTFTRHDASEVFAPCDDPPDRVDVLSYRLVAAATLDVAGGVELIHRTSGGSRTGSFEVSAASAMNEVEVFAGSGRTIAPDGGVVGGTPAIGPLEPKSPGTFRGIVSVRTPGVYSVVARPIPQPRASNDPPGLVVGGPWTESRTVAVKTRFDLGPSVLLKPKGKGPRYGIRMNVDTPEAHGTSVRASVRSCVVRKATTCKTPASFKRYRSLGRRTVGADGLVSLSNVRLAAGRVYLLRLDHAGNERIAPGWAGQALRVFGSGKASLRPGRFAEPRS
jgi:hypothetical protein